MSKTYLDKAASMQHIEAIYQSAQIYEFGLRSVDDNGGYLVNQNLSKAEELYTLAKEMGHSQSVLQLGVLCYKKKLFSKSIEYFQLAAEMENPKAYFNYAKCYEQGIGVERDFEQYQYLIEQAIKLKVEDAMIYHAAKILKERLAQHYREAFQLLIKNLDNPESSYYLGWIYEIGLGKTVDYKTAIDFYQQSADLKYPPAINKLGDIYYQGVPGVNRDIQKSIQYYEEAAKLGSE